MSATASPAALMQSWNVPELNKRLKFVVFALAVFVFGTHITAPGIDHALVQNFFETSGSGGLFSMIDIFSGGAFKKFSIFALGIMPYINASIMMQLLVAIEPSLKAIQQEGEEGRKRISKITRYVAIALAFLQGGGLLFGIYQGSSTPLYSLEPIAALFSIVAGTCFLMWLGDEITTKGIGNGTSLIIMIGIVASVPGAVYQELSAARFENQRILALLMFAVLVIAVVAAIVLIQLAVRKIPIQYARRQIGRRIYGGQSTYLPIKVTQAGVIPIIFAISVLMVPPTIFGLFGQDSAMSVGWGRFQAGIGYPIVEFLLVFFFTFVYTAVTFQTQDVADNLKKNNGFIPGIRPGKPTFVFLDKVLHRVTFFGAVFLGLLAILPLIATGLVELTTGVRITSLYLGGTSLLIVVGVALDTVQQMQAHMVMRHYSGFTTK
jgi:preprotein translocase subunit SecY